MSAIILLIFIGVLVAGGFLAAFIWAVKSGQYDDDYSPSVRILFDKETHLDENQNDIPETKSNQEEQNQQTNQEQIH